MSYFSIVGVIYLIATYVGQCAHAGDQKPPLVRSAQSGPWSSPKTWEGGKLPQGGAVVQLRTGHTIIYDMQLKEPFRAIHVAGTLRFAHDKDTLLTVRLLRIQAGENIDIEDGFECDAHVPEAGSLSRPALLVGTPERPIQADKRAEIALIDPDYYKTGVNNDSLPAIVCCGGRMDMHGAPMSRTWVKLGATAKRGDTGLTLADPVEGWRAGDWIIVTATTRQNKQKKTFESSVANTSQTEERAIDTMKGTKLSLSSYHPLFFEHLGDGEYCAEVANLSRNVLIRSVNRPRTVNIYSGTYRPGGVGLRLLFDPGKERVDNGRGHVMYHRNSAGSISYTEFRDLGKPGVLGRYNLHYHLCGDTMRGSSVIGCSFVDSYNRWLTIHGTNYLVVRDCVGYQSYGHGFFLEDGTEVNNILDRNLAVQAYSTKPLPKQVIPFDKNDGAGLWWANCHNSFTRNVAAECDEYGYFFQCAKTKDFDPNLRVLRPDGSRERVDVRTLPFIRFEDNVTHCQRRHGFNLGGGVPFGQPNVGGVGPDVKHPFHIRNFMAYNTHWAIHPVAPSVLIDGMKIVDAEYGVWRPVYQDHAYRGITMVGVPEPTKYAFVTPSQPPIPESEYPGKLSPVDELPPVTVITHALPGANGKLFVRGSTADNGTVKRVLVNDKPATATTANFLTWEVSLDGVPKQVTAHAEDEAGNVERMKHVRAVR